MDTRYPVSRVVFSSAHRNPEVPNIPGPDLNKIDTSPAILGLQVRTVTTLVRLEHCKRIKISDTLIFPDRHWLHLYRDKCLRF